MKVIGTNQLAPTHFTQSLPKGVSADGWRNIRGKLRAPLFYCVTTALCALAVLLLSVLLIGGLDRFGIAPQDSFLGLNLTLITGCLFLLLSPLRSRIRHSSEAQGVCTADAALEQIKAEPIGKLLIIRRHKRMSRNAVDARRPFDYRREQ
jgi:predicted exporter